VSESALAANTRLPELGIDSVAMLSAGIVLQAELEVIIPEHEIVRIFMADTVSDSIAITCEVLQLLRHE
jgi:acyl carrier protein